MNVRPSIPTPTIGTVDICFKETPESNANKILQRAESTSLRTEIKQRTVADSTIDITDTVVSRLFPLEYTHVDAASRNDNVKLKHEHLVGAGCFHEQTIHRRQYRAKQ